MVAAMAKTAAIGPVQRLLDRRRRKAHLAIVIFTVHVVDHVGEEEFACGVDAAAAVEVRIGRDVAGSPPSVGVVAHGPILPSGPAAVRQVGAVCACRVSRKLTLLRRFCSRRQRSI